MPKVMSCVSGPTPSRPPRAATQGDARGTNSSRRQPSHEADLCRRCRRHWPRWWRRPTPKGLGQKGSDGSPIRRLGRLLRGVFVRQARRRPGCAAAAGEPRAGEVLLWDSPLCDGWRRWPWIWRPGQIRHGSAMADWWRVMGPGWGGRWSSTGFPTTPYVHMARVCSDPVSGEIVVALLLVKITPTSVMADADGVSDAPC